MPRMLPVTTTAITRAWLSQRTVRFILDAVSFVVDCRFVRRCFFTRGRRSLPTKHMLATNPLFGKSSVNYLQIFFPGALVHEVQFEDFRNDPGAAAQGAPIILSAEPAAPIAELGWRCRQEGLERAASGAYASGVGMKARKLAGSQALCRRPSTPLPAG